MSKQHLWFKNKRYGWGWVPATWEGWLVMLGFVVAVVVGSWLLLGNDPDTYGPVAAYILWITLCASVLVFVSYKKGEKPGWHWGDDETQ